MFAPTHQRTPHTQTAAAVRRRRNRPAATTFARAWRLRNQDTLILKEWTPKKKVINYTLFCEKIFQLAAKKECFFMEII